MNKQELEKNVIFHNRYELIERLGKGGFSTVWKARDKMSDIVIAVKIFLKQDKEGVELCRDEFRKTHDLKHPSILRPFHFDVYDQQPYIVMPFLSGGSMEHLIGNITHDQFVKLYKQLASAIAYLHSRDQPIIHGDIKPDNILMDHQGNFYLTDFGISQRLENSLTMTLGSHHTSQSAYSNKGITPMAFRAPEHFNFKNWKMTGAVPASDLWAFGISMHYLVEGEIAFSGEGGLGQLIMMSSGNLELAEIISLKKPFQKYEENIFQCLQLDPHKRSIATLGQAQPVASSVARPVVGAVVKEKQDAQGEGNPSGGVLSEVKHMPTAPKLDYLKKALMIGGALLVCIVGLGFWMSLDDGVAVEVSEQQGEVVNDKESSYLEYYQSDGELIEGEAIADGDEFLNEDGEDGEAPEMNDESFSEKDVAQYENEAVSYRDDVVVNRGVVQEGGESSSNVSTTSDGAMEVNESRLDHSSRIAAAGESPEVVEKEKKSLQEKGKDELSGTIAFDEKVVDGSVQQTLVNEVKQELDNEVASEESSDIESLKNEAVSGESKEYQRVTEVLKKTYRIKISPSINLGCQDDLKKGNLKNFIIQEDIVINDQVIFKTGQALQGRVTQSKCSSKGILQQVSFDFRNHVVPDGTAMRFKNLSLYLKNKGSKEGFMVDENETYTLEFVGRNEYDFKKFIYAMYDK